MPINTKLQGNKTVGQGAWAKLRRGTDTELVDAKLILEVTMLIHGPIS